MKHEQRQTTSNAADRPLTGSARFPELVWAHWVWQREAHPHTFPLRGRVRRFFARASRTDGRPSWHGNDGGNLATALSDSDLLAREEEYMRQAEAFQSSQGEIVRAYWCSREASAVVLTAKKRRLAWLPFRRHEWHIHQETDWVTAEAPKIADLLHDGDVLAVRVNRVLPPVPQSIAMEWIFNEQSYLLGFVERTGGRPSRGEAQEVVARHEREIDRLERYYDRAARKAARIQYFVGMLVGLVAVAALGVLSAGIIDLFDNLVLESDSTRNFYACFGAGAVGAMVSVMMRMRREDGVQLDYEVGPGLIVVLGAFRPILGAIFGTLTYFALVSGFLALEPPSEDKVFFYFPIFAFAAGFSERFVHVILGKADLSEKTAGGAEAPEQVPPAGRPQATAAPSSGPVTNDAGAPSAPMNKAR